MFEFCLSRNLLGFFDVDHVIAACVLFDFRTEVIMGDHFLCGASLFLLYCLVFPNTTENDD